MTLPAAAHKRDAVGAIRNFMRGHGPVAWALIGLTLCMKLLVPTGFMPHVTGGQVALIVCDGMAAADPMAAMPHMAGQHHEDHAPARPDAPCPFAGLTAPTLGGADPIQLAIATALVIAAGISLAAPRSALLPVRLWPPLRGPPVRA